MGVPLGNFEFENWSRDKANSKLRDTGSCVVVLQQNVLLHVLHVNTVGNQRFSATVFSKEKRKYARMQSNTTKTRLLSRLRFVSDKKRLCSQHGYKNTRMEFSSNPSRSANYTSNAKYLLQPYFRSVFETVGLSQGTCVVAARAFTISNVNLTCYIYGVANPFTVMINMKNTKEHFHTPFFFSSVNVAGEESRHQMFTSMSINSQKVRDAAKDLPQALGRVASLLEIHVHLNRLCCEIAQERRGMLTSLEKLCLVYLTEVYFVDILNRSDPKHWEGYKCAVKTVFDERYKSELSSFQDKVLTRYHLRNPEFVHMIPWFLANKTDYYLKLIRSHESYLKHENKLNARMELLTMIWKYAKSHPDCPQFLDLSDVMHSKTNYAAQLTDYVSHSGFGLSKQTRRKGRVKENYPPTDTSEELNLVKKAKLTILQRKRVRKKTVDKVKNTFQFSLQEKKRKARQEM